MLGSTSQTLEELSFHSSKHHSHSEVLSRRRVIVCLQWLVIDSVSLVLNQFRDRSVGMSSLWFIIGQPRSVVRATISRSGRSARIFFAKSQTSLVRASLKVWSQGLRELAMPRNDNLWLSECLT
ncbi:hypothetical protein RRG08_046446 [Elysia crispata]|uniref:Uncharacterized protein n=1 Tax=Elysia crispata TaxID=231223 RepID=A0AAE0YJK1_9GAST|nr:hypothetical protein RRG08_046446 [Elysia crispata]